jgi:hypothetical protein
MRNFNFNATKTFDAFGIPETEEERIAEIIDIISETMRDHLRENMSLIYLYAFQEMEKLWNEKRIKNIREFSMLSYIISRGLNDIKEEIMNSNEEYIKLMDTTLEQNGYKETDVKVTKEEVEYLHKKSLENTEAFYKAIKDLSVKYGVIPESSEIDTTRIHPISRLIYKKSKERLTFPGTNIFCTKEEEEKLSNMETQREYENYLSKLVLIYGLDEKKKVYLNHKTREFHQED